MSRRVAIVPILALVAGCLTPREEYLELLAAATDSDGDGFHPAGGDCDDTDPTVHPGAVDIWYDGVDQDCAGDDDFDLDLDGHQYPDDCDDHDDDVNPAAVEVCNGVDDDCDGEVDEGLSRPWYRDRDGDGQGRQEEFVNACLGPDGYVDNGADCDDDDALRYSGAEEVCGDGVVNDCLASASTCRRSGELGAETIGDELGGHRLLGVVDDAGAFGGSITYCDQGGTNLLVVGAPRTVREPEAGRIYVLPADAAGEMRVEVEPLAAYTGGPNRERVGEYVACLESMSGADETLIAVASRNADRTLAFIDATATQESTVEEGADRLVTSLRNIESVHAAEFTGDQGEDLLVGVPDDDSLRGVVYLLSSVPGADQVLSQVSAAELTGEQAGDGVGLAASSADVDGDGIADALVGAPGSDSGVGGVAVLYGPFSGGALKDDVWLSGEGPGDAAGTTLTGAGDVDGDGLEDFLVGAPSALDGTAAVGRAWLVLGSQVADGSLLNAAGRIEGSEDGAELSEALGMVDHDGDGHADLVLGAQRASVGYDTGGAAFVFYGPVEGVLRDVDADYVVFAESNADRFASTITPLPDITGDGLPELALGAPKVDAGEEWVGAIYLLHGQGD